MIEVDEIVGDGFTVIVTVFIVSASLSLCLFIVQVIVYVFGLVELIGIIVATVELLKPDTVKVGELFEKVPWSIDQVQSKLTILSVGVKVSLNEEV